MVNLSFTSLRYRTTGSIVLCYGPLGSCWSGQSLVGGPSNFAGDNQYLVSSQLSLLELRRHQRPRGGGDKRLRLKKMSRMWGERYRHYL